MTDPELLRRKMHEVIEAHRDDLTPKTDDPRGKLLAHLVAQNAIDDLKNEADRITETNP